ncbi:MFS transporter [Poseidonocella sp. HB161398]|uniref:MFS transporter n=1 Tax=Poseidonocella sp. HB161398 TaxID=2320855 RepID=UPI001109BB91|nr:MFS transporter [Poseidonocella sp. HB161398]
MTADSQARPVPRRELLRNRGYALYIAAMFLTGLTMQIQTVAVGWQVYDLTRDPFDLGLVGLSQFAPALALVLVTGAVVDRVSRRRLLSGCMAVMGLVSAGLWALSAAGNNLAWPIFALICLYGTARAFLNPARQALVTNLVPAAQLPQALALNASASEIATVCGPVAGGLLYALSPQAAYGLSAGLMAAAALLALMIPKPAQARAASKKQSWQDLTAGFRHVLARPIVLGAISLDLFVVLLGGAFAMLPVYARDILDVGAVGLGLLRGAPAIGAIGVAFVLMACPIRGNAGRTMFLCVAGFSLATLVFALSETVWLSVLALVAIGATDVVSVIIRQTLVQLHTPDELRGRVGAVNAVFIGASNELGGFRSGSMAALFGPVPAVAGGALVSLGVCALWMRLFPALRRVDSLAPPPEELNRAA